MTSRIQFGRPREEQIPERPFPLDLVGKRVPAAGSFVVLLDVRAWKDIQSYGRQHINIAENRSVECAGLLAGLPFFDRERQITFVAIRDVVETEAESQSPGSVRIAPQDFERARRQIDTRGLRVVGWYHTHPDYGIFLSHDDQIVVRSLFNASWHVALVFDPIRDLIGCFHGRQCERVDDDDRNMRQKRNYVVVDDWPKGFWEAPNSQQNTPPGSQAPNQDTPGQNREIVPAPPVADTLDIVPEIWPDSDIDPPGTPIDPQGDGLPGDMPGEYVPSRQARRYRPARIDPSPRMRIGMDRNVRRPRVIVPPGYVIFTLVVLLIGGIAGFFFEVRRKLSRRRS